MQIEHYRDKLEEFHASLSREFFEYCTGGKRAPETARVYSEYSDLFSTPAIEEIRQALDQSPPEFPTRRRGLEKFLWFAARHRMQMATSRLDEEIAVLEQAEFEWEGSPIRLSDIPGRIASEPDTGRRRRLNERRLGALRDSESVRRERLDIQRDTARSLGYKSHLDAEQSISGADFHAVLRSLDPVLNATESGYLDQLQRFWVPRLGDSLSEAAGCDLFRFVQQSEPEHFFTRERLDAAAESVVEGLSIRPETSGAIVRTGGNAARFSACIPVRVPSDVRLVVAERGGHQDYATLLHELGHAHHFAWTGAGLPAEHRLVGDRGLSEGYAFLLESVLHSPAWLRTTLGFESSDAFLHFRRVLRACEIRHAAATLRFALWLDETGDAAHAPEEYGRMMKAATGIAWESELYLAAAERCVPCADYLTGWAFEAALREHFLLKFGTDWYRTRAAGRFLKEVWETGLRYTAAELSGETGAGALDYAILADQLEGA